MHRFLVREGERTVIFDDVCAECACWANGPSYDGELGGEFVPRSVDELAAFARPHHHDDHLDNDDNNDDDDPTAYPWTVGSYFPRCLPELGHRDARAEGRVDPRRNVRGGWLGWFKWYGLSRLAGDQRDELVGERGMEPAAGRGPRDAGLADHGGRAHPDGPTRSGGMRGVVMVGRKWLA